MPLLGGCSQEGFERLVESKFQYNPKWQDDPEKVLEVMAKAAEEWALVEIELRDCVKAEGKPMKGSSSKQEAGKTGGEREEKRPKTPVFCYGYGDRSRILTECKE